MAEVTKKACVVCWTGIGRSRPKYFAIFSDYATAWSFQIHTLDRPSKLTKNVTTDIMQWLLARDTRVNSLWPDAKQ